MLNQINFSQYKNFSSFMIESAKFSGKAFGENLEIYLPMLFRENGIDSSKIETRNQEYDIIIANKPYSLKSTTTGEIQISTLSDKHKTKIDFNKDILSKSVNNILDLNYLKSKIVNKYKLEDFIFGYINKENLFLGLFSINIFFNSLQKAFIKVNKKHTPLQLFYNNKVIAELKDDTGKEKANAFQRGLWLKNIEDFLNTNVVYDLVKIPYTNLNDKNYLLHLLK